MFSNFSKSRPNFRLTIQNRYPARSRWAPPLARRRGVALIYTALGLAGFMGITALVVDMGSLYTRRAQAQRAADAAALAGAYDLQNPSTAEATAIQYAKLNGYDTAKGATVTPRTYASSDSLVKNRIEVVVQRREPLYFLPAMAALFGENKTTSVVGARATAEAVFATNPIKLDVLGGAEYGSASGFANPSVFGPNSLYEYGDAYSPLFKQFDNVDPNTGFENDPAGTNFPGYEYRLDIAPDYVARNGSSQVQLEIFDPDCYVVDSSNSLADWDEIHVANQGTLSPTVTKYTLLRPERYPGEPQSSRLIAEATYGADEASQDGNLKWTTPNGFTFDINDPNNGPGSYSLIVKALSGSSENGFQLRAGPPHSGLRTEADFPTWKQQYNAGGAGNGTSFSALGKSVFNFTRSGQITVSLGYVPSSAESLFIDKFDTDIGATSVNYSYKTADGASYGPFPGTLSNNGQWNNPPDRIDLPASYASQGGATWYATYNAAAYDTSTWKIKYSTRTSTNTDPSVRLVD